jgi:hypothetical protein
MNKLKATFLRQYRKKSTIPGQPGRMVFVYAVSGSPEAVQAYEAAQGDNLIHDDVTKAPLMFTINPGPARVNDVIQTGGINGSPVQFRIDTSELDRTAAIVAQYGGNLGQALAEQAAKSLNLNFGGSTTSAVAEPQGSLTEEAGEKK